MKLVFKSWSRLLTMGGLLGNATLRGFIKKELTQTLRDPRMRIVLFGVPLIQLTVFGLALSNEVRNIRLKIFYPPGDVMARRLEERCLASTWFVPSSSSQTDPYLLVKTGQADAVLITPPEGLTKAVARQEGRLQLLVDASNAIRARSVESYVQAVLAELASDSGGVSPPMGNRASLQMDVRLLFNPSMETPIYLVPGVMCMILCLLTIILSSMSMSREKELGTFETLIAAPVSTWEILLGKTLPFVLLGVVDVPLIVSVAVGVFHVPFKGALWQLVLASFVFVCTTVSIGTLISTFAKNQQQAMMGGFLFLFPAIQLSGVMAPLDNIPFFFKIASYLNPLRYFVVLLRNIMLKGGSPAVVWPNIGGLFILCLLAIAITTRRFHKTLN